MAQGQPKDSAFSNSVKKSITPTFLRNIESEAVKDRPAQTSKSPLQKSSLTSARSAERPSAKNSKPNFPSHKDNTTKRSKSLKDSALSNFKKKGPIAAIVAVIFGAIIALFAGQSFLFSQLENLITSSTDSQYTYMNLRSRAMTKQMLAGKRSMPKYTEKRLKSQGITVTRLENGTVELEHNGTKVTADNFDSTIKNNAEFRESFNKAKHGRVANFFDSSAKKILNKLGITRNRQSDVQQTSDANADELRYRENLESHFAETSDAKIGTAEDREFKDEETGETRTKRISSETNAKGLADTDVRTKASNYISAQSSKVADAGGLTCAAYKVGNMVAVTVSALATYQAINYFMDGMENTSKTLEEKGSQSYINQFLNFLTEPKTTTYTDIDTGEEVETYGSPVESAGLVAFLAGTVPIVSTTRHFSREAATSTLSNKFFSSTGTINNCSKIQGATAAISLATLAIPGAGFAKIATGFLVNAVKGVALGIAVSSILAVLVPFVAQTIFSNVAKSYLGKPAGEFFASGAYAANSKLARQSTGLAVVDKDSAIAYAMTEKQVLAEDAEIDRKNHSPLDPTNPNTFLGSLISKTSPLWTSQATLLSRAANILTSSLPKAFADGENSSYDTTFGDCPNLESAGIAGDAYCNPLVGGDLSTIDLAEDDPAYRAAIDPNLDANGNIKDGSELAAYITYGMNRTSPDGVVDANILEACHTSFGVLDNVPYLSDVVDIINAVEDEAGNCLRIATGEEYLYSKSNPKWDTKYKYFQAYVAENRIMTQLDSDFKNPVTAYVDKYDREHPLDESYAGIISAITGQTKSDVETTLAFAEYLLYLSNYNPDDRYAFTPTKGDAKRDISNILSKGGAEPDKASSSAEKSMAMDFSDTSREKYITYAFRREAYLA